jgi:hypothetical protein
MGKNWQDSGTIQRGLRPVVLEVCFFSRKLRDHSSDIFRNKSDTQLPELPLKMEERSVELNDKPLIQAIKKLDNDNPNIQDGPRGFQDCEAIKRLDETLKKSLF